MDLQPPQHAMDTARCVVTASFLGDLEAIEHLVNGEENHLPLIMSLAHLNCHAMSHLAHQQGVEPFVFWQNGLHKLAEHRSNN